MGVYKTPEKVQNEIANINDGNSSKEVTFNPQTGELEVVDKHSEITPNSTTITDVANDGFAGIEKRPEKVQEEIANINDGSSGKEVAFNPQTGELEVVSKQSESTPGSTTITDVANDGFASLPIVYAYEDEVIGFLNNGGEPLKRGVAFEWKGEDVYHVHLETPKTSVSGNPCMSFFTWVNQEDFSLKTSDLINKLGIENHFKESGFYNKAILCIFSSVESKVQKKACLLSNATITECNFRYVPQKSELYSRSKGLLEIDVLEKK
jgi:hypothetical protein